MTPTLATTAQVAAHADRSIKLHVHQGAAIKAVCGQRAIGFALRAVVVLASSSTWPQGDPFRSAVLGRPASSVTQLRARDWQPGGRRAVFHASHGHRHLGEPAVPFLATLAFGCVLLMVIIWAAWINPINKTVNSWTPDSLPSNWAELRDRWHFLHTIRRLNDYRGDTIDR